MGAHARRHLGGMLRGPRLPAAQDSATSRLTATPARIGGILTRACLLNASSHAGHGEFETICVAAAPARSGRHIAIDLGLPALLLGSRQEGRLDGVARELRQVDTGEA